MAETISPDSVSLDESALPALRASAQMFAPSAMTDEEIQRNYRVAESVALSGLYKDVDTAAKAFVKLTIGRALGLNEYQALSIYIMEGKVELSYTMLGFLVRRREGYDFRPAWIKAEGVEDDPTGGQRVAVYLDKDTALDMRAVVGAAIEFTVDGEMRGVSTWTIEDSERAELNKPHRGGASNHTKYPRNMFLARAMSNGVKWLVPEVTSGVAVYAEGEIERDHVPNLAEGGGDGSEPGWSGLSIADVHAVEKVIRYAQKRGHGLGDKATAQMALNDQPPAVVQEWLRAAREEFATKPPPDVEGSVADDSPAEPDTAPEPDTVPVSQVVAEDTQRQAPAKPAPTGAIVEPADIRQSQLYDELEGAREEGDEVREAEILAELDALAPDDDKEDFS